MPAYTHICFIQLTFADCSNVIDLLLGGEQIWNDPMHAFQIRLQDGEYPSRGRVEYYLDDGWSGVCPAQFDEATADAVCQQLGYTEALSFNEREK